MSAKGKHRGHSNSSRHTTLDLLYTTLDKSLIENMMKKCRLWGDISPCPIQIAEKNKGLTIPPRVFMTTIYQEAKADLQYSMNRKLQP